MTGRELNKETYDSLVKLALDKADKEENLQVLYVWDVSPLGTDACYDIITIDEKKSGLYSHLVPTTYIYPTDCVSKELYDV